MKNYVVFKIYLNSGTKIYIIADNYHLEWGEEKVTFNNKNRMSLDISDISFMAIEKELI